MFPECNTMHLPLAKPFVWHAGLLGDNRDHCIDLVSLRNPGYSRYQAYENTMQATYLSVAVRLLRN